MTDYQMFKLAQKSGAYVSAGYTVFKFNALELKAFVKSLSDGDVNYIRSEGNKIENLTDSRP